jgi:hypothetical protein
LRSLSNRSTRCLTASGAGVPMLEKDMSEGRQVKARARQLAESSQQLGVSRDNGLARKRNCGSRLTAPNPKAVGCEPCAVGRQRPRRSVLLCSPGTGRPFDFVWLRHRRNEQGMPCGRGVGNDRCESGDSPSEREDARYSPRFRGQVQPRPPHLRVSRALRLATSSSVFCADAESRGPELAGPR